MELALFYVADGRTCVELRWIFSELGPGAFRGRAEENGVVRQRFEAVRRG